MTATGGAPVLGAGENFRLILGDSREKLAALPDNSVDAVVTDPPYELGFMGRAWDSTGIAYNVDMWRQVLRVLRPGGHLLAFGGSRTYHRITCAIEDAGFEIRDCIMWIYGSGFPKSLDVSKAIDKAAGEDRPDAIKGGHMGISIGGGDPRNSAAQAIHSTVPSTINKGAAMRGTPITNAALQWSGWGTALKPAHEPVVVARKPMQGTVADNVLRWGTGAVNVDGCRIDAERDTGWGGGGDARPVAGRWPANVIHDGSDEVVALFPETAPSTESNRGLQHSGRHGGLADIGANIRAGTDGVRGHADDGGSAARFFYCAKASREDRDEWLDGHHAATAGEITGLADGSAGLDSPRAGAGRTAGGRNIHPTVKPTELMRYLCRLVTPPGGIVLDPFTGSGSTGKAALLEGFRFVGIEREAEYIRIAQARIANATKFKTPDLFTGAAR